MFLSFKPKNNIINKAGGEIKKKGLQFKQQKWYSLYSLDALCKSWG